MVYKVTGIPAPSGAVPMRRDVNELSQSKKYEDEIQFSLFIRALKTIQELDYKQPLSWYQIAGIHDKPHADWDGSAAQGKGFCNHNKEIFPTWHRPYVLLLEQVLHENMIKLVNTISDAAIKEKWIEQANKWRLPFWDFAKSTVIDKKEFFKVPIPCTQESIDILKLGSAEASKAYDTIDHNPLYKFQMKQAMGTLDKPYNITQGEESDGAGGTVVYHFEKCWATTRYGMYANTPDDDPMWQNGLQDNVKADEALTGHDWSVAGEPPQPLQNLREEVYRLFSKVKGQFPKWEYFASTIHDGQQQDAWFPSVEYIHNAIHGWGGGWDLRDDTKDKPLRGAGHFGYVPVASFDPIFWLHHCNVDRLTAIAQVVNDVKWFNLDDQKEKDLANTQLVPFHKTDTEYHTSNTVREWKNLGYDYDVVFRDGEVSDEEYRKQVTDRITKLYGEAPAQLPRGAADATLDDCFLSLKYNRYQFNGSPYSIIFSIDGETIGSMYSFSSSVERGCPNCEAQNDAKVLSHAIISVTDWFVKHNFELKDPDQVKKTLQEKLQWKVRTATKDFEKTDLNRDDWGDLSIVPVHSKIRFPNNYFRGGEPSDVPTYSDHKDLGNLTW